ncbi:AraC family transcriptional regulator [Dyella halodurans]|uniref:GyrI-like domain-containing protein n=1 Tax=Dyella halodurans TaxID=1920171 RepID=A0ABV9C409_9GAMM|nr:GyrI-like domain-containing protein [Dyella halodurans]
MEHRIVTLPSFTVVGMEHLVRGSVDGIGQLWRRFMPREHEIVGRAEPEAAYGVCRLLAGGSARYVAGLPVLADASVPVGMVKFEVPAQTYVVFTHRGTAAQIGDSFQAIHTRLLARLGLRATGGVEFERYDARFTGPEDPAAETDLYIPVD